MHILFSNCRMNDILPVSTFPCTVQFFNSSCQVKRMWDKGKQTHVRGLKRFGLLQQRWRALGCLSCWRSSLSQCQHTARHKQPPTNRLSQPSQVSSTGWCPSLPALWCALLLNSALHHMSWLQRETIFPQRRNIMLTKEMHYTSRHMGLQKCNKMLTFCADVQNNGTGVLTGIASPGFTKTILPIISKKNTFAFLGQCAPTPVSSVHFGQDTTPLQFLLIDASNPTSFLQLHAMWNFQRLLFKCSV